MRYCQVQHPFEILERTRGVARKLYWGYKSFFLGRGV